MSGVVRRIPIRPDSLLPFALAAVVAGAARADEIACWFERGVITVPAEVAGIAGDYILDTGSPRTTLHETAAQANGIADETVTGDVRFGGLTARGLAMQVADLDLRTWNLPTPAAGVIGADALRGFVLDVSYAPCRVQVSRRGKAPRFAGRRYHLGWDLGRPTVRAAVSDDAHRITGRFVVATGANAPVRLADDLARASVGTKELYPEGAWLARLPEVDFGGARGRDVAAGLMKPEGEVVGVLGGQVLAHFRLRFDFPAGRLIVDPVR